MSDAKETQPETASGAPVDTNPVESDSADEEHDLLIDHFFPSKSGSR